MPEHVYLSTQLDEFILLPYDAHTHTERDRGCRPLKKWGKQMLGILN